MWKADWRWAAAGNVIAFAMPRLIEHDSDLANLKAIARIESHG
jgi:hypothetical protein